MVKLFRRVPTHLGACPLPVRKTGGDMRGRGPGRLRDRPREAMPPALPQLRAARLTPAGSAEGDAMGMKDPARSSGPRQTGRIVDARRCLHGFSHAYLFACLSSCLLPCLRERMLSRTAARGHLSPATWVLNARSGLGVPLCQPRRRRTGGHLGLVSHPRLVHPEQEEGADRLSEELRPR